MQMVTNGDTYSFEDQVTGYLAIGYSINDAAIQVYNTMTEAEKIKWNFSDLVNIISQYASNTEDSHDN